MGPAGARARGAGGEPRLKPFDFQHFWRRRWKGETKALVSCQDEVSSLPSGSRVGKTSQGLLDRRSHGDGREEREEILETA